MKICLFTDSLGSGGAQRQLVGLAILLKNTGAEVFVITYYNIDFYKPFLDEHEITNVVLSGSESIIKRIGSLISYLKKLRPSCLIAYQETPSLLACFSRLFLKIDRLIVSERNTTQRLLFRDRIRFFMYRWADAIVPNSYSQALFITKWYSNLKSKIHTITNFVDLDVFCPVPHVRNHVPIILNVGGIWYSKNTKAYIEACHLLKERGIIFKTILLGWTDHPNDYMNQIKALVNDYEMEDMVLFRNKTLEIIPYYQAADYYCIPSLYEGTPNVLCEAIACGLPVAASRVCDNSRYVKDNVNGVLFDPLSPNEIADAIQKLFSLAEEEYQVYRIESRRLAVELLSKESFLNSYMNLINTSK